MRRKRKIASLLTLSFCVIGCFCAAGFSQTAYEECRARLADVGPEDLEQRFFLELELTDHLRGRDMLAALKNAQLARKHAEEIGDPDLVVVARLAIISIIADCSPESPVFEIWDGRIDSLEGFKLTDGASDELQLHFDKSIFEIGLWASEISIDEHQIALIRGRVSACPDSPTSRYCECCMLVAERYRLGFTFLDWPRNQPTSEQVDEYQILKQIIAAQVSKDGGSSMERLELARAAARSLGNRRFEIIALREIAQLLTDKGSYSEAVEVLKTAEKVAKKFGSVYFNKDIHIRLFAAESAAGQHKPAAFRMRDYVVGEQFQNDSSLLNHRLLRLAESSSAQVGDDELAAVFDSIQLPEKAISEFKANAKLIDSLGRKLSLERLESRRSAEKTLEQHREEISSFETKVQTAQRSFLITSCLATLLAFGLGAIYLASRYSNVAEKLDETEVSTLENRELCNELSVRLSRMERMDSLNRMAGGVAHDFNNILASVIGNAEIIQMKSNGEGDSFTQERLSGIIESAEKAANLSRQMLTYAGRSHTRRELVDVNKLIAEYKPVLMSACGREQNLSYVLSASPLIAPIDSIQLETALLNLVTNSSEASGSQGSIVIRSGTQSIETVEDTSLFGTRNSGGEFGYIEVYDEGTGISQEDLERIFEPFYTKSIVGRGLGLAVVYGVIENHDGFVQCHSTLESSTSFKVLFPLQVEQPKNGRADWQVETGIENGQEMPMSVAAVALDGCNSSNQMDVISRSNGSRSVLVVDDEHAVRELCNALLSVKNVEVIQAIDGEEGLGLALQNRERLDFVLLDITMPKMDGEEVLQAFLENDFDVPVVLMTGYSANKQEKLLEFPNVVSIIQKPFRAAEIFEQFEKIASSKL